MKFIWRTLISFFKKSLSLDWQKLDMRLGRKYFLNVLVCLFGVFCPTLEFFTLTETSSLPVGEWLQFLTYTRHSWPSSREGSLACHIILWHGASTFNGHLRGPATLTSVTERLAVELSLPIFTRWICRGWDSNTKPSASEANALTNCSTAAVYITSLYLNKLNEPEFPTSKNVSCQVYLRW